MTSSTLLLVHLRKVREVVLLVLAWATARTNWCPLYVRLRLTTGWWDRLGQDKIRLKDYIFCSSYLTEAVG